MRMGIGRGLMAELSRDLNGAEEQRKPARARADRVVRAWSPRRRQILVQRVLHADGMPTGDLQGELAELEGHRSGAPVASTCGARPGRRRLGTPEL